MCSAKSLQSCPPLGNPLDYIAQQVPLCMEFSRQEYCSGLPFPSPGNTHSSKYHSLDTQEGRKLLNRKISSQPRDQTHVSYVSCTGRQVLYHWSQLGSPLEIISALIQIVVQKLIYQTLKCLEIQKSFSIWKIWQ